MSRSFGWLLLGTVVSTFANQGCQHPCRQPYPAPPPVVSNPVPVPASPYAPAPQAQPEPPPAPVPATPPPASIRSYEPPLATPAEPSWRPSTGGDVRLAPPEGASTSPSQGGARLQAPQFTAPPPSQPSATPVLPAGIPQFALALEYVATGLKPMLDGVDWLKQNGYRTVLHLRQPGEDDAADRRLFEMRGLKYLGLELSPQTLSRTVVDEFNRIVADRNNYPLFVYDKTGALTGGLWYLHFREAERLGDEESRMRASRLGLRETQNGLQREMWLAIQKYLSESAR